MSGSLIDLVKSYGDPEQISCAKAMRLVQSAIDGELGEPELTRFHRHLEICKKCGMKTKTYEAIKGSVARQGQKELPEDVVADLEAFARGLSQDEAP